MSNKVIVNGVDVFKDIEYKENLIKDLKDVISKQEKLLSLYKELSNYVCEQCYAHKLPEITRLKILIKELEIEKVVIKAQKQEKLLELYKEFFDKLNIQLRNTFDIDYIYPHEFIIGYDIRSEDKELVKLFKQIKELENDK